MHNIDQPNVKDVDTTPYMWVESENFVSSQANALLENRAVDTMKIQSENVALVEKGILGNFSISNDQIQGKPVQMAEAYTAENAPVPIKILPPGPRPVEPTARPKGGSNIGEGSNWVKKRPGS